MTEVQELYKTKLDEEINEDERPTSVMAFDYSQNFLADVKKSNLLSNELEQTVQAMLPELQHGFQTQTIWRTETEIMVSVLNDKDFPDKAAKYHQAKLEQKVFFEQLLQLSFEYRQHVKDIELKEVEIEEKEVYIEGLNEELSAYTSDSSIVSNKARSKKTIELDIKRANLELDKLKIELEEMLYGVENMKIQGRERTRELEIWSRVKEELNDGSFDIDNRDTNQLISFTKSYIKKARLAVESGEGGDVSGYANIIAQFDSGVKMCVEKGLINELLTDLDLQDLKFLNSSFPALDIRNGDGKSINEI